MNILMVSLTRFGDLLQTQAAITDVFRAGHTVGVVCLQNFLPALHLMQHVEHAFPFVGNSLLAQLSYIENDGVAVLDQNTDGWLRATKELTEWKEMLWRQFRPDVVIGLSPARASRLLTKYIAQNAVVGGFSVDAHGALHNTNLWASVMQGTPDQRGIIPYNLVDIFRAITAETLDMASGCSDHPGQHLSFVETRGQSGDNVLLPPPASIANNTFNDLERGVLAMGFTGVESKEHYCNPAMTAQLAAKAGTKSVAGFVGVQLGASAMQRQWPLSHFTRVGDYLWDTYRLAPVLLGSKAETPLAKEYETLAKSPCISMVGKTGLVDLGALLSHCLFLITNDTGTMHLAAGLGIPSFAIFLATAQPFDTGPYLPGCYCFEPDLPCHPCNFNAPCPNNYICREVILPETVIACIERMFGNTPLEKDTLKGSRVWLTTHESGGTLTLKGLGSEGGSSRHASVGFSGAPGSDGQNGSDGQKEVAEQPCDDPQLSSGTKQFDHSRPYGEFTGTSCTCQPPLNGITAFDKIPFVEESKAVYAASREGLVRLQRSMIWAFVDMLRAAKVARQTMSEGVGAGNLPVSPPLLFDVSTLEPGSRACMAEEAARLASQLEILEKQGEILLMKAVELMKKRFLQSWEEVSSLLKKSPWFCFLHSLWCDLTQARGLEFTEIMGAVSIFREIFACCAESLQGTADDGSACVRSL